MAPVLTGTESLRRLFAAVTENTFQTELGVVDPKLVDYLTDLLVRFVRIEVIFHIRDAEGRRLEEVAEMVIEAEERQAKPQREIYRHIGDFTLFWSGVYPEKLRQLKSAGKKDQFIDYCQQGKRSYMIASTFVEEPYRDEAPVLQRLSHDFELCSYGLNRVRREWESLAQSAQSTGWDAQRN